MSLQKICASNDRNGEIVRFSFRATQRRVASAFLFTLQISPRLIVSLFAPRERDGEKERSWDATGDVADPTDCQIILLKRSFGGAGRARGALFLGDSSQDSLSLLSFFHPSRFFSFLPNFCCCSLSLSLPLSHSSSPSSSSAARHVVSPSSGFAFLCMLQPPPWQSPPRRCQMFRLFSLPTVPNQCPDDDATQADTDTSQKFLAIIRFRLSTPVRGYVALNMKFFIRLTGSYTPY